MNIKSQASYLNVEQNIARSMYLSSFYHFSPLWSEFQGGKKELDLNRFEELYADFYLSDDINSPGQYIAGPFPNKDIY